MPNIIRRGLTLSEALQEAAAIAPITRVMLRTYELWHPSMTEALRFVDDKAPLTATLESDAPRDPLGSVEFLAMPLGFEGPGEDDSGSPETIRLARPDVGGVLKQALDVARVWPDPMATWSLIERIYASDDLTAPAILPPLSLEVVNAEISGPRGVLEARYDDDVNVAVPRITFRRFEYPGLGR